MQIGGMNSFMKLKVKNKKNLFSDYSLVLFILLSIFLIFIDIKNIINPSLIRSNTLDLIFSVNDFFKSNYPDLSKYKANFASNEELISENEFLKEKLEQSNLFKLKSEKLEIENNILKISGSRDYNNENDNSEYHYQERTHGSFHRSFKLPISVVEENISATFKNGILTVVLPKNEEAQPKQRTIKII